MTSTPRTGRSSGGVAIGDAPGAYDRRRRRSSRSAAVLGALAGAVLALVLGVSSIVTRRAEDAARRDHALQSAALAGADTLNTYFVRSRDLLRLAAQNPSFAAFTADPRPRLEKVGDPRLDAPVVAALRSLVQLHPAATAEACFIDSIGHENARLVRGVAAAAETLSTRERENVFFLPTLRMPVGAVYQAAPYRSPDTGEWVISNSTPIHVGGDVAVVHYEVTIESFRAALAAAVPRGMDIDVIDRSTGTPVLDTATPQLIAAPLGEPEEAQWRAFRGRPVPRYADVDGRRIASVAVDRAPGNVNDWFVAASVPSSPTWSLAGVTPLAVVLLLIGAGLGGVAFVLAGRARAVARDELAHAYAIGREAEERSRTDVLTGLLNRRGCLEALHAEIHRASRGGGTPGLLMIDADNFKRVNDTYGHQAGDDVLVEIGRRLHAAVRPYDTVARWGGEEFCVVIPELSSDEVLRGVAESLRSAISTAPLTTSASTLLPVTVSIGGVRASEALWTAEAIVDAADRALYAAKRRGRDCVRLFADMTVEDFVAEEPESLRLAQALALSAAVREGMPELHAQQVAEIAEAIAIELGLDQQTTMRCRLAGWLHDIGKVAIPDRILAKPGPLDDQEWAIMRTHAAVGEQIVRQVAGIAEAGPGVRGHHERWDGTGYPDQLEGSAIPIEARVVAAADAYAAMTGDRVYRRAWSLEETIAELRRSAGSHLDPDVVAALISALAARRAAAATRLANAASLRASG
jgi:diguanylate cyclase (GGDEF)-like protein